MTSLFTPGHYLKFVSSLFGALIVMAVLSSFVPKGVVRDVFQTLICPVGAFVAGWTIGRGLEVTPPRMGAVVFVCTATMFFMAFLALILFLLMWGGGGTLDREIWTGIAIGAPIIFAISAVLGVLGLRRAVGRPLGSA